MEIINNCTELLNFLRSVYSTSKYCCGGIIEFQGEICEIGGFMPESNGLFLISPNYPMTVFLVGEKYISNDYGEVFNLYLFMGKEFILDQTLCVVLPISIQGELIATIKGEW